MLYATLNGEKIEACPRTKAICPLCERQVYSKCGEVNVWHWAHLKDESCDSWYEPETEWHKNWKLIFGKDNSEIVISKEGVRHIADIFTKSGVVIELQNSPIQRPIIRRRENFYAEKMLWVINGINFKHNFFIESPHYIFHSSGRKEYPPAKDEQSFSWDWARKSWNEVQRNVFIDFGEDFLFWVNEGMGTRSGNGVKVSKERFVKKYGGDIEVLSKVIEISK